MASLYSDTDDGDFIGNCCTYFLHKILDFDAMHVSRSMNKFTKLPYWGLNTPCSLWNRRMTFALNSIPLQLISNATSEEYQRRNWELLKRHIHGQINKVNVSNIVNIVRELLQKNVIRGM